MDFDIETHVTPVRGIANAVILASSNDGTIRSVLWINEASVLTSFQHAWMLLDDIIDADDDPIKDWIKNGF